MSDHGYVGFFDILGYRQIISNNNIDHVSEIISNILIRIPDRVSVHLLALAKTESEKESLDKCLRRIQSRLISDSIVLVMSDDNTYEAPYGFQDCFTFLSYASLLLRMAFDAGLPMRGAVDYGEFFLKGSCFAGNPIINCHAIGSRIQLAGCVLGNSLRNHMDSLQDAGGREGLLKKLIFNYIVPFKNAAAQKYSILNWYYPFSGWGTVTTDLRTCVLNAFLAHNKDIPPDAVAKIDNTEIMLHRCSTRN